MATMNTALLTHLNMAQLFGERGLAGGGSQLMACLKVLSYRVAEKHRERIFDVNLFLHHVFGANALA